MGEGIHQEDGDESRPNFSCDDGTMFIYSRVNGVYEPYKHANGRLAYKL